MPFPTLHLPQANIVTQGTRPTTKLRAVRATTRTSKVHDRVKTNGVHYTPPSLAAFLASALYRHAALVDAEHIRVLDPACGDGSLLVAFAQLAPPDVRARLQLVGHDTDGAALAKASASLSHLNVRTELHKEDFLSLPSSCAQHQGSLFETARQPEQARFDVVIANPPYVRTQVLGAAKAEPLNLASLVVNEVRLLGSRCGPFEEAINALARKAVDVRPLVTKTFPIEQAVAAFEAVRRPETMKVLLRINPR
jgi:SAM-dependent methyltransferase